MKIVIAPDSFKGNMTSTDVADCIEEGIRRVFPESHCIKVPVADGGEGTVHSVLHAQGGSLKTVTVTGPSGKPVRAVYGILSHGSTAVIEAAAASGLMLINPRARKPLKTTSYGTGELILDAINGGVRNIIVGVGGSGTVDGGAGLAQALGVRFRDERGRIIRRKAAGGMLNGIAAIDVDHIHPQIPKTSIRVAADVTNPLCGRNGAARVYGPQKGATPDMVKTLDTNLNHFARLIKQYMKVDVLNMKGAGAAGGMGAALAVFAGAEILSGIDIVLKLTKLEKHLRRADLVITGEGSIDSQTPYGKVPAGVARLARTMNIPVLAIGGGLSDDARKVFGYGIDGLASAVARDMSLDEAIRHSREHLANAAERCMRLIMIGIKTSKK